MKLVTVPDLSYIAGFMDGEGSFHITRTTYLGRRKYPSYQPRVSVANTDHDVLCWLQHTVGFGILAPKYHDSKVWKDQWQWYLRVEEIRSFTIAVLPYLKIKTRQAQLVLEFLDLESNPGGVLPSEHVVIQREVIYQEITELNKRGR